MNILYISSKKRWGGVVSWMLKTSEGLRSQGHNVWILSHPNSKFNKVIKSSNYLIEKKLGPTFNPITIIFLIFFIKRNKIDIVVTNIDKEVGIGGIAAKICGIPNIRRVGREDDFNNKWRTKVTHNFLVTKCIVPCNYVIDASIKRASWLNKESFSMIYNGRNPLKTDFDNIQNQRRKWGINENERIIGMTCQLTKVKFTENLITAFFQIHQKWNHWKLVITGEGPELEKLQKLVEQFRLEDKVKFIGFTNDPLFIASCYDICASVSKLEGFPNTVVEYFAARKPVISTDVGGVSEIIQNEQNGLLVPFGDEKALVNALSKLIIDETIRIGFANKALQSLEEKFTEDIMNTKLEIFFKEQLK
jgi:glycosyltransferase involved in cell wall biosynthesis